jgi:hypothetical protein
MCGSDSEHAVDGVSGDILPTESPGWDTNPSLQSFQAGEAVFHRNWTFAIAKFGADGEFGRDLGVMPYPYGVTESNAKYAGSGGSQAKLGGWHLSINHRAGGPRLPQSEQVPCGSRRRRTRADRTDRTTGILRCLRLRECCNRDCIL